VVREVLEEAYRLVRRSRRWVESVDGRHDVDSTLLDS